MQERLAIEHPVGERAGFDSVYQVCTIILDAFSFQKDCLGQMGERAQKVMTTKTRRPNIKQKKLIIVENGPKFEEQRRDCQVLDRPAWDPCNE